MVHRMFTSVTRLPDWYYIIYTTVGIKCQLAHNIYMDREEKPVKKVTLVVIKGIEKFRFSSCCKSMPMLQKFVVRL